MNFKEAVCAAIDGREIRRALWADETMSIRWCEDGIRYTSGIRVEIGYTSRNATDWEIVGISFEVALKALKKGKHVKRASWDFFIFLGEPHKDAILAMGADGCKVRLSGDAIDKQSVLEEDWIILGGAEEEEDEDLV